MQDDLRKRNLEVARKLKALRDSINYTELETIIEHDDVGIALDKVTQIRWNIVQNFASYLKTVAIINGPVIDSDLHLKSLFNSIMNPCSPVIDITDMKAPLNQGNPLVVKFYNELKNEYKEGIGESIKGTIRGKLQWDNLNEEEKNKVKVLEMYIESFYVAKWIEEAIEFMHLLNVMD